MPWPTDSRAAEKRDEIAPFHHVKFPIRVIDEYPARWNRKLERIPVKWNQACAACSVCSLPPCGGGLGRGVVRLATLVPLSLNPHPQPLPTRGRGAHRVRGTCVV